MSLNAEYFSMQGRLALGIRNADGSRGPARWVFDTSTLEWNFTQDQDEQNESWSGARGLAATLPTKKSLSVKLTLNQLNDDNAALASAGVVVAVTTGTVTAEPLPIGKVGDMVALEYAKVSDVELTGGVAGTTPLVENTDYTLNAATGVITYLTAQANAPHAAYSYGAHSIITAITGKRPEFWVLFDGENTVDGAIGLCRGEVNRVSFPPASTLALINSSFGTLELTGKALVDPMRISNSRYGGYARLMLIDAEEA